MNNEAVVLITSRGRSVLAEALLNVGLTPLQREGIQGAVETLRREQAAGVLVNAASVDVDVLELLLNIRDVSPSIPVAVVGNRKTLEQLHPLLEGFADVVLLPAAIPPAKAAEDFVQILQSRSKV